MTIPILTTKLFIPPPRSKLVIRHHLLEQLNAGLRGKLILISAPVGFGKTTLISEWLSYYNIPTAWLSLDEGDNDLSRFQSYLVAALRMIAPNIGNTVLTILQSNQPSAIETILTLLLNDLADFPKDFLLVLDDYHWIDAKAVKGAVNFLLEHLPPKMHLVITTREDPALPLARLRAHNQLTELRATNLRFTQDEATVFFDQVMGLHLPQEAITALEDRTEGWIAGLQLAALSLQSQQNIAEFIQSFGGDHRYIVDYLVEEVLERQPESVSSFLLQTSILDRLNGSLCDAVTGQDECDQRLKALERSNFFLIPLDNQRHWYRYHHLFADVLRVHLMAMHPQQFLMLHRRASEWYEQHGWTSDAIRHALIAKDFEHTADLIEMAAPDMRRTRQETTLLGWFKALPNTIFHNRPVLNIEYVGALLSTGKTDNIEMRLLEIEQLLKSIEGSRMPSDIVVVNEQEYHRLHGWIALYRAGLSLSYGSIPNAVMFAQHVLDVVPDNDHMFRGAGAAIIGLASWTEGNLEVAYQSYANGMAHLQKAGNISDAVGGSLGLADIRIVQGRLREAHRIYERALELATSHNEPQMRGTADMYVGLCEINRQYNNLPRAEQYLLKAKEQGDHTGFPQNPYRWRVAMAHLHKARGDLDGALALLHEAEHLYVSDFYPNVCPVTALKVRVWIALGRLDEAFVWVREQSLSVDNDVSYLHEFEHITLVRVLLAQYKYNSDNNIIIGALNLLNRLLQAASSGERTGSMIEILILQALAYQMQRAFAPALAALEYTIQLAEPEGYIRIFLDEGSGMEDLLHQAAEHNIMPDYTHRLLDAFYEHQPTTNDSHNILINSSQDLIDPLSQRELEILQLFKTDLSGPEIARELVIALSTVRTHTKSIYSKLNVNSRRSAVTRASELNLI